MAWSWTSIKGFKGLPNAIRKALDAFVNTTTGHAHDGTDTRKILETNLTMNTTAGHDHDGTDSKLIPNNAKAFVNVGTAAEINTGKTILSPVATLTYTPIGFTLKVSGNFAGNDGIALVDTATSNAATIAVIAVAALTDGAIITPTTSGVTVGAGYLAAITAGKGIKIIKTGSSATAGTNVTAKIEYLEA